MDLAAVWFTRAMALETVADLAVEQPEEGVIDIYALITARWVVQFSALLSI